MHGPRCGDQLPGLDVLWEHLAGGEDRVPTSFPDSRAGAPLLVCSLHVGIVLACDFADLVAGDGLSVVCQSCGSQAGHFSVLGSAGCRRSSRGGRHRLHRARHGAHPGDLRNFKKTGGVDKWVLVKREGRVAVFKAGGESQTIRTAGLYVPIEVDTMRGDQELVKACRGHDRVHLCRSLTCGEDGQHFKEYGIAKDFDAEKFQLKNAELGAAKAGRTLWAWLWTSPPKKQAPAKEFASESETEPERPCEATKIIWSHKDGDQRLPPECLSLLPASV